MALFLILYNSSFWVSKFQCFTERKLGTQKSILSIKQMKQWKIQFCNVRLMMNSIRFRFESFSRFYCQHHHRFIHHQRSTVHCIVNFLFQKLCIKSALVCIMERNVQASWNKCELAGFIQKTKIRKLYFMWKRKTN